MTIAICLIIKDENQYLEEWLNHHRKLGIDFFIIYDNNSEVSVSEYIKDNNLNNGDIDVHLWTHNQMFSQVLAYEHCYKNYKNFDYIGFIDIDEFYYSVTMNIKKDFDYFKQEHGHFEGIVFYWRNYGNYPYFTERQPIEKYIQWKEEIGVKTFANPKLIVNFLHPHHVRLKSGNYIDEVGEQSYIPGKERHSSRYAWLKHTWTRSLPEWDDKIKRGDANNRKIVPKTKEAFFPFNKDLKYSDMPL